MNIKILVALVALVALPGISSAQTLTTNVSTSAVTGGRTAVGPWTGQVTVDVSAVTAGLLGTTVIYVSAQTPLSVGQSIPPFIGLNYLRAPATIFTTVTTVTVGVPVPVLSAPGSTFPPGLDFTLQALANNTALGAHLWFQT